MHKYFSSLLARLHSTSSWAIGGLALVACLFLCGEIGLAQQCNGDPSIASVSFQPSSLTSNVSITTGTVTLSCAPASAWYVTLNSNSTAFAVPAQVAVPGGQNYATFTTTPTDVAQSTVVTVTATLNGTAQTTVTVNPLVVSLTASPNPAVGGDNAGVTLSVSLNANVDLAQGYTLNIQPGNGLLTCPSSVTIAHGSNNNSARCSSGVVTSNYSVGVNLVAGITRASTTVTLTPLTATLTISPSVILSGTSQRVTWTATITNVSGMAYGIGFSVGQYGGFPIGISVNQGCSTGSTQTSYTGATVTQNYIDPWTLAINLGNGYVNLNTANITVVPTLENGSNAGVCLKCLTQVAAPINLTSGNTYVQQHDYSLPGLAGGIEITRTWNSLESSLGAPATHAPTFGRNWSSNYEDVLTFPNGNTAKYWRSDGSAWTFTYNSAVQTYYLSSPPDQRVSIYFNTGTNQYVMTFADGTQRLFTQGGYLKTIKDRNANQTTVNWDSQYRITTVSDAAGRVLTFHYDNPNICCRATSISDATGTIATYTYDSNRLLLKVLYADGSSLNMTYDSISWMLLNVKDGQGKLLESHTYDGQYRGLTSTRANNADNVSITYNSLGTTTLQDSMGRSTAYGWQQIAGHNYVNAVSGPGCSSCGGRGAQALTYDTLGNVSSSTDALGRTTNFTYDSNGNVLTRSIQLDANNTLTWSYTYNSFQEVLTATDPMGNVTTNTYDTHGNLLTTTTPPPSGTGNGLTTGFSYDTKGQLTQVTDPNNHSTTIAYNTVGLISSITDAQNNVTSFLYDARGNRTSSTDAPSHTTTFGYDSMSRLTSITQPGNIVTSFGYDARGRRTSVTDANSKTTQYAYDDADRLISVTDAAQHLTIYGYDTENHLQAITDALSRVTSFSYDPLGRVTGVTFPSTLTESYTYDDVGNLASKTDRKGQTISYGYDNLDRLTSKTYPDSTAVSYSYDGDSRLVEVQDSTGTYDFSYDHVGRLLGTTTNYSFLNRALTTGYSYDAASNRLTFTDPEGATVNYTYDSLNRLTNLTDSVTGAFGFGYDVLGRRTSLSRPNGVSTNYQYDNLSRLLSVLHQVGGSTVDGAAYTVDAAGNRLSKADALAGVTSNYSYDAIYQLTQTVQGLNTTESYSYDGVGNRLSSLGVSPYSYNSSNELTSTPSVGFTYDNNGNTTSRTDTNGTTTYSWDFENQLTGVTLPGTGGTVSFQYDPFGRRIEKVSGAGTSVYAYDGDNVVEELDSGGMRIAGYTQGLGIDEPLAMSRSSVTSFYQADGLGSVTSLTDGSGQIAASYTYDSFGNITNSTGSLVNPFRYTGREFDSETGLYYYRARYYDPGVGRFLSEDPISFDVGLNYYRYADNNPVFWADPTGLLPGKSLSPAILVPSSVLPGRLKLEGNLDPLCQKGRNFAQDALDLLTSISTREDEIDWYANHPDPNMRALAGDPGHLRRIELEEKTLQRCKNNDPGCEEEKKRIPDFVPPRKWKVNQKLVNDIVMTIVVTTLIAVAARVSALAAL